MTDKKKHDFATFVERFEQIDKEENVPMLEMDNKDRVTLYTIIQMFQRDPMLKDLLKLVMAAYVGERSVEGRSLEWRLLVMLKIMEAVKEVFEGS